MGGRLHSQRRETWVRRTPSAVQLGPPRGRGTPFACPVCPGPCSVAKIGCSLWTDIMNRKKLFLFLKTTEHTEHRGKTTEHGPGHREHALVQRSQRLLPTAARLLARDPASNDQHAPAAADAFLGLPHRGREREMPRARHPLTPGKAPPEGLPPQQTTQLVSTANPHFKKLDRNSDDSTCQRATPAIDPPKKQGLPPSTDHATPVNDKPSRYRT